MSPKKNCNIPLENKACFQDTQRGTIIPWTPEKKNPLKKKSTWSLQRRIMIDFTRLEYKRFSRQLFSRVPLLAATLLLVMVCFITTKPLYDPIEMAALPGQEVIGIYKLNGNEPRFLANVFPSEYSTNGSLNIHQAHVQGLPHIGALIHILDRSVREFSSLRPLLHWLLTIRVMSSKPRFARILYCG